MRNSFPHAGFWQIKGGCSIAIDLHPQEQQRNPLAIICGVASNRFPHALFAHTMVVRLLLASPLQAVEQVFCFLNADSKPFPQCEQVSLCRFRAWRFLQSAQRCGRGPGFLVCEISVVQSQHVVFMRAV